MDGGLPRVGAQAPKGSLLDPDTRQWLDDPSLTLWRNLCELIDNHYGSAFELTARYIALTIGASMVALLIADPTPAIWLGVYASTHLGIWHYMRSLRAPGTKRQYRIAIALDMTLSAIFIFIVPYSAIIAPPEAAIAPFAIAAGFAVYNISRCSPIPIIALWESALTIGAVCAACWIWIDTHGATRAALAGISIAVLAACYAGVVAWDGVKRRLLEREVEFHTIAAQRMEAVGQLSAGLAHEFNNILAGIKGHLELAELDPDFDARGRSLAAARAGAARAAGHVQHLLSFARKAHVEPQPTDLAKLLRGCEPLFLGLLGVQARLDVAGASVPICAIVDKTAIEGALANLVLNSRDAGADLVSVSLSQVSLTSHQRLGDDRLLMPGSYAMLTVADNGPGMPKDLRARATEPFFTTKAPGAGTGLGLSMARGTAEQMGGGLRIEDGPGGRGLAVSLLLPECPLHDVVRHRAMAQSVPPTVH